MNCEQADALLIDLACGELAAGDAAALRAHVDGCDACGRALSRLETGRALARQLPRESPRPAAMVAIMAAARAKAAAVHEAAIAPAREETPAPALVDGERAGPQRQDGPWASLMRWMGSFAMGPQVAMAMLLMLMVGIGFLYLPTQRGESVARPAVDPDPDGLRGAGALEPADPLPLRVDPRTHRIVSDEGGDSPPEVAHVRPPTRETTPLEVPAIAPQEREVVASAGDVIDGELAAGLDTLRLEELGASEGIGSTVSGSIEAGRAEEHSGALAMRVPPSRSEDEGMGVMGTSPSSAGAGASAGTGSAMRPEPSGSSAGSGAGASARASAMRRPEIERPTMPSVEPSSPPPAPGDAIPIALHRQARSAMDAGSLGVAARTYTDLITRHPRYADAPRAMLELAECERRLGHLSSAETWLTRAARQPSVAREAERQLARVRAERRAADHSFEADMAEPDLAQ